MKHFKIINFDTKMVSEFDIKDDEMLVWNVAKFSPGKEHQSFVAKVLNKTISNNDHYRARKSDLK